MATVMKSNWNWYRILVLAVVVFGCILFAKAG